MKYIFFVGLVVIFISCSQDEKKEITPKEKFDKIENITGVANWQMIDRLDTSFIYFSRVADNRTNIYHFNIQKGDSLNTITDSIVAVNDTVYWNGKKESWYLKSINDSSMQWAGTGLTKNKIYDFIKTDSTHISFQLPDSHLVMLTKTLPLSAFLIRSKYDYEHGTDIANKDTVFHPHKK
jgi:outer membrane lipoprotein-sorting protein